MESKNESLRALVKKKKNSLCFCQKALVCNFALTRKCKSWKHNFINKSVFYDLYYNKRKR